MPGDSPYNLDHQFIRSGGLTASGSHLSRVINPTGRKINSLTTIRPSSEVIVKANRLKRPLSSPEFFEAVLLNSGPTSSRQKKSWRANKAQVMFLSLAIASLLVGGYYTVIGIRSVKASKLEAANLTSIANKKSTSSSPTNAAGLSTAKISASTLADYHVAPNMPRYLIIPKINVDARVLNVGVTANDEVGTPYDIYDTAWYNESALPGQNGAMLIDGHISSWTAHGVFYNLRSLVAGDIIQVERGDGTIFSYKVIKSQLYPANNVNMTAVLSPVISNQPGLNLMTCAGEVIPGSNNFSERLVVFASLIN